MSEAWRGSDPITAEEILMLDDYCRERHIELVPSFASFGHLYQLLSTKSYGRYCELENSDSEEYSWISWQIHHTINLSDSDSIRVVRDMIEEVAPLFSSDKFNICCDETFDIGRGKSKKQVNEKGKGRLYADFLNKLCNIVRENNKQPMF